MVEQKEQIPTLTDEQIEQARIAFAKLQEAFQTFADLLAEIVSEIMARVRAFAEQLARFFVKMQLLEWRVPVFVADYLSEKLYWRCAFWLGFRWLKRKMVLIE